MNYALQTISLRKKKIELLQIIEALKEEKEVILKTISDINAKIEGQNKKIDDQYTKFQELLNDKIKMQEASLISDILFQLYKQFILKNKDDNVIKENFITYKKKVVSKTVYIANIDTKFFHRCLNNQCDDEELNDYIKEKFKLAVNETTTEKKHSYESNERKCVEMASERNKKSHSELRDISKYSNNEEFFSLAKQEIEQITKPNYKEFGKELLEQIQNLYKVNFSH